MRWLFIISQKQLSRVKPLKSKALAFKGFRLVEQLVCILNLYIILTFSIHRSERIKSSKANHRQEICTLAKDANYGMEANHGPWFMVGMHHDTLNDEQCSLKWRSKCKIIENFIKTVRTDKTAMIIIIAVCLLKFNAIFVFFVFTPASFPRSIRCQWMVFEVLVFAHLECHSHNLYSFSEMQWASVARVTCQNEWMLCSQLDLYFTTFLLCACLMLARSVGAMCNWNRSDWWMGVRDSSQELHVSYELCTGMHFTKSSSHHHISNK